MKVKTAALTGIALDWIVASLEFPNDTAVLNPAVYVSVGQPYGYAEDWAEGGPIIGRHHVDLIHLQNGSANYEVLAQMRECADVTGRLIAQAWAGKDEGPERDLIAAMRCYVAPKLGDEVDLPKELLP